MVIKVLISSLLVMTLAKYFINDFWFLFIAKFIAC